MGRWIAGLLFLAVIVAMALLVQHELRQRKLAHAALIWDEFQIQSSQQDMAGVRRSIVRLRELTPDDPRLARWEEAILKGRADPTDLGMVRLVMNEHLRTNRLDEAAREAAIRVASIPRDWQSRCVLAHFAHTQGQRDEAHQHLAALPSPFDMEKGIGPGPLLYALQLARELGEPNHEMMNYLVLRLLPALESTALPLILLSEKLQLLEAYTFAFLALNDHPDLGRYWVPAAALGRSLITDPAMDVPDFMRLGYLFEQHLQWLRELQRRGKFPAADVERLNRDLEDRIRLTWDKIATLDPKQPAGYVGLALSSYRAGQTPEAEETLKRGLASCGDRVELLAALGRLQQSNDPEAGLALLSRMARERPGELALLRLLAEAALSAGRPDVALTACQDALKIQPALPWACRVRGQVLLAQGRPLEAASAFEPIRGELLDAAGAELYVRALCNSQAPALAEAFMDKVAAKPQSTAGLLGGARALLACGREESAARWAEEITNRTPDDRAARLLHADALRTWAERDGAPSWDANRVRSAIQAYDWLRKREPSNFVVVNNIAWLELKGLAQPTIALHSAAPLRAVEESADLPAEYLETLGAIYLETGEEIKAARLLERAVRLQPARSSYWIHLAKAYVRLGRDNDARRCLDRASQLSKSPREADDYVRLLRQIQGGSNTGG